MPCAECARARAAYEPRYAAIAMAHQQQDDDPYEGIDPHKKLEDLVRRFWAAKEAEEAETMIDVTPEREPEPVEVKPEIDDDDPADGEAVWSESDDDPADGEAV